ncbi:S41 family peptidase [Patulibacter medicamentivorans]|uniref:S41 family peptidase n=1 Tax=Patulibacter medicamentivorans TaxID=1097667 RepID=UPI000680A9DD|nr:S41 family peptidase [Patulibacter medicamentivorans]
MSFWTRALRAALAVAALFVVVVLIFSAGAYVGARDPQSLPGVIRDRVVDPKGAGAINEALGTIRDVYYRDPGERRLVDDAIGGMVTKLDDRFSNYLNPKTYENFQQAQDNRFDGIGVVVREDPLGLRITQVYPKSPAKAAGLQIDDLIVNAGRTSLKGLKADQASNHVRGPAGTSVALQVRRRVAGRVRTLRITSKRAPVEVPIVDSKLFKRGGHRVGVVRLAQFNNGATQQVATALERMRKRGADRFVLDLRSNPGGLVTQAQGVASLFLKGGTVVTLKGRTVGEQRYAAGDDPLLPDAPLVVVVDRGSASASEIVTGALQDRGRAKVVGTRTYGKGVFQRVEPLSNGGALDITAGQYFTPKGRNLGGKGTARGGGLQPNVEVKSDPKAPNASLDRAIAVVARERGPR